MVNDVSKDIVMPSCCESNSRYDLSARWQFVFTNLRGAASQKRECVISGFRRGLNEIFALLECYTE